MDASGLGLIQRGLGELTPDVPAYETERFTPNDPEDTAADERELARRRAARRRGFDSLRVDPSLGSGTTGTGLGLGS